MEKKNFQLVAVNQIVFCSQPGIAGTYAGDVGTPPKLRKILAGTIFVVNTQKEYDDLISAGSAVPDEVKKVPLPLVVNDLEDKAENPVRRGPGRPPNNKKNTPSEDVDDGKTIS